MRSLSGILLLDKPIHVSSNKALLSVKRLLSAKKAGHAGCLDPLATGMLPIFLGEATKLSNFFLHGDKEYEVEAKLGIKTDTQDILGQVIQSKEPCIDIEHLKSTLLSFVGNIEQTPPMYSAIKFKGTPLYKYARKGIEISRKPRNVSIYSLSLTKFNGQTFAAKVHCSKGTYIRSLIDDIGDKLGCGACVTSLRRTKVKGFSSDKMLNMQDLKDKVLQYTLKEEELQRILIPAELAALELPAVYVDSKQINWLRHGRQVSIENQDNIGNVRIKYNEDDSFMGIGIADKGFLKPKRMFLGL